MSSKKDLMDRLGKRNNSNFENKGKLIEEMGSIPTPQTEEKKPEETMPSLEQKEITSNNDIEINSNTESNIDIENESNINSEIDTNIENTIVSNIDTDFDSKLDSIFEGKKKREEQVSYRGFYIENDLVKVLDRLGKKHGKGVKSELINELLRKEFSARGLLK